MTGTEPAVLEPERIERMRANVMGRIEQDRSARRGRRTWLAVGGAAAAAVVVIGAVGAGLNGGLTSGADSLSAGGTSADVESAPDAGANEDVTSRVQAVITTGSLSARVDDVQAATAAVRAFANAHDGRIDSESLEGGSRPHADLTVRVPDQHLAALREVVADEGEVLSMNVAREDVAAQVADVDARMESLEAAIRRLRAIVAESDTTKDLLAAEAQLTRRQASLESLQAQRRVLGDQTSLATIQVSLSPTEAARSVEPGGFVGGVTRGWNGLAATTNALVTAAGVAVPWLLPLALLGGVGLWVRRRL